MGRENPSDPIAPPVLAVSGLSFGYGRKTVLHDVGFEVRPGRATILLGLNGSGKTTLFALISRLLLPRAGRIEIGGRDIRRAGSAVLRHVGIVFQQTTLDLDLSVEQNLRYFAALRGMGRAAAEGRIAAELEALGLAGRRKDRVRTLNGGHRRRLEIARALLDEPALLLLDEPTVGLDIDTRRALVDQLHDLAERSGIALLWATHLLDEIRDRDRLLILERGRLVAGGAAACLVAKSGEADLAGAFRHYRGRGA